MALLKLTDNEIAELRRDIETFYVNAPNNAPFTTASSKMLAGWIGQDENVLNYLAFKLSNGRDLHIAEFGGIRVQLRPVPKTEIEQHPTVVRIEDQRQSGVPVPSPMVGTRPEEK